MCKIKLNEPIIVGENNIVIPPGIYDGYKNGPGGGWPVIIYKGEEYDFVDEDLDVEFI